MKKSSIVMSLIIILIISTIYIIYNIYIRMDIRKEKENITSSKEKIISKDLRIGIKNFDSINPIISKSIDIQNISRLIFEPLINLTYDYKLEACLAKEWVVLDDNSYLIKLNENIRWQDGSNFSAEDVIFTINTIKDMKNDSLYYENVVDITEINKIDNLTIKIKTNGKIPYFEYNLIFPIISSKYYSKENILEENKKFNTIGTGMYYITDINKDNLILKSNSNWWQNKELSLNNIYLKIYKDLKDEIKDIEDQKIDLINISENNINIDKYKNNTKFYIRKKYDYKFSDLLSNAKISNNNLFNEINFESIIGNKTKEVEENSIQDETFFNSYIDKNMIVYSRNLKGEITPNTYNIFYNIENWYREYDKR